MNKNELIKEISKSSGISIRESQGITVDWETEFTGYMKRGIAVFTTYVKEWYTGNLQTLFFHQPEDPDVKRKICAVLAGYVWDEKNPFVKKHDNLIKNMAHIIEMETKKIKNISSNLGIDS